MSKNTNKYAKTVEWYLFREKEIKQAVAEARLDVAFTGNTSSAVISSPTENAALRNIEPLQKVVLSDGAEVFKPEQWLLAIKRIYEGLDKKQKTIAKKRYRQGESYMRTCINLTISQTTYFQTLTSIRNYAVVVAVQAGLVKVF
mgnify:FL=1